MWKIIDENGTIHSGNQEEMEHAFDVMTNPTNYNKKEVKDWTPKDGWEGDLELVEVHNRYR